MNNQPCVNCKHLQVDYNGSIYWMCCYPDGTINYTPGLINGDIPEWCPFYNSTIDMEKTIKGKDVTA